MNDYYPSCNHTAIHNNAYTKGREGENRTIQRRINAEYAKLYGRMLINNRVDSDKLAQYRAWAELIGFTVDASRIHGEVGKIFDGYLV